MNDNYHIQTISTCKFFEIKMILTKTRNFYGNIIVSFIDSYVKKIRNKRLSNFLIHDVFIYI